MQHKITRLLDKKSHPATINRNDAIAKGLTKRHYKLKFAQCKSSKALPTFAMPDNGQCFCANRYRRRLDRFLA